jgi:adenylyl cyclase-associated protein
VSKDEMTHKNPALRASSVVADGAIKKPSAAPVKSAVAAKKPPKIEQNGNKWLIENFEGNNDLKIEDGTPKTAVLFVKCTKSLLQVPGKINTLSIDSCVKSQVLVDSCVAQIEIINCTSVQIQV